MSSLKDYGSNSDNHGSNSNKSSFASTPRASSIKLHSTLDSVAFLRSSPPPPPLSSFSPVPDDEKMSREHAQQFSPLIRMLSFPASHNNGNNKTEHECTSLHLPSLDTPLLVDDTNDKSSGDASNTVSRVGKRNAEKGESEFIANHLYSITSWLAHDQTFPFSIRPRLHILHCICTCKCNYVRSMPVRLRVCGLFSRRLPIAY